VNTYHLQAWNEIILHSNPPVPETPLSPFLPFYVMEERSVGLDGGRVKTVSINLISSLGKVEVSANLLIMPVRSFNTNTNILE
jgi:hypothetical protein